MSAKGHNGFRHYDHDDFVSNMRTRRLYTSGQIARLCRVAPRTVCKWMDSGFLKGYRIPLSNERRVAREDLCRFLIEHDMPYHGLLEAWPVPMLCNDFILRRLVQDDLGKEYDVIGCDSPMRFGLAVGCSNCPCALVVDRAYGREVPGQAIAASYEVMSRPQVIVLWPEDVPEEEKPTCHAVIPYPPNYKAIADAIRSSTRREPVRLSKTVSKPDIGKGME